MDYENTHTHKKNTTKKTEYDVPMSYKDRHYSWEQRNIVLIILSQSKAKAGLAVA